jgi:hypothetical protein
VKNRIMRDTGRLTEIELAVVGFRFLAWTS